MAQPRIEVAYRAKHETGPIAILNALRMRNRASLITLRVGDNLKYALVNFLARVVTAWAATFGRLDRLVVDDACRGASFSRGYLASCHEKAVVYARQQT